MKNIPLNKLQDRCATGCQVVHFSPLNPSGYRDNLPVHRDDNYLFLLIKNGQGSIMVDFETVHLQTNDVYFVLPSQVHHQIRSVNAEGEGWFVLVDPARIDKNINEAFQNQLRKQKPVRLNTSEFTRFESLMAALHFQSANGQGRFHLQVLHHLLNALLASLASCYNEITPEMGTISRSKEITRSFKKLLSQKVRTEKSPTAYAGLLNISQVYLNEVVKEHTGNNVTFWIQAEVVLEASRLLVYTELTVKEIAYQLGYEDRTYFSRLFKQCTQLTPLNFRKLHSL